jgi:hypothetical protein
VWPGKIVPQATWFMMGPKVDFNLISHPSLFCILHKAYLVVYSSEFIPLVFVPIDSWHSGFPSSGEPIKLHCPKTGRSQ